VVRSPFLVVYVFITVVHFFRLRGSSMVNPPVMKFLKFSQKFHWHRLEVGRVGGLVMMLLMLSSVMIMRNKMIPLQLVYSWERVSNLQTHICIYQEEFNFPLVSNNSRRFQRSMTYSQNCVVDDKSTQGNKLKHVRHPSLTIVCPLCCINVRCPVMNFGVESHSVTVKSSEDLWLYVVSEPRYSLFLF